MKYIYYFFLGIVKVVLTFPSVLIGMVIAFGSNGKRDSLCLYDKLMNLGDD